MRMRCACCDATLGAASTPTVDRVCASCGGDPYGVPCPYHTGARPVIATYLRPDDPQRSADLPGGAIPYRCPSHGLIYG